MRGMLVLQLQSYMRREIDRARTGLGIMASSSTGTDLARYMFTFQAQHRAQNHSTTTFLFPSLLYWHRPSTRHISTEETECEEECGGRRGGAAAGAPSSPSSRCG